VWQARPGGDGSPADRDAGGSAWRVGRRTQNVPEAGRLATVTQHRCDIGALSVAFADLDVIAAGKGRGEAWAAGTSAPRRCRALTEDQPPKRRLCCARGSRLTTSSYEWSIISRSSSSSIEPSNSTVFQWRLFWW
jgi:hypothetical protein